MDEALRSDPRRRTHSGRERDTRPQFFLHISPDEQLERLKARLDDPTRRSKISESDDAERALWAECMAACEEATPRASTEDAPWYVISANHGWFRNLAVSRIAVETLESFGMQLPHPAGQRRRHSSQVP